MNYMGEERGTHSRMHIAAPIPVLSTCAAGQSLLGVLAQSDDV
jgi:hypothetical protein